MGTAANPKTALSAKAMIMNSVSMSTIAQA
jgi:hypothetical protein